MTTFTSDIDIDLADRDAALRLIAHTAASIRGDTLKRHPTGIYVTDVPWDPLNQLCALDYKEAEQRGYVKLDLLNVWVYKHVRSEQHLQELMQDPDWSLLQQRHIFHELIHVGKHWDSMRSMPEPIDSVEKLAMFLAVIRPGKRHLLGKSWSEVSQTIWLKEGDGYQFKRSHSIAYAQLVIVNLNLVSRGELAQHSEELGHSLDQGN